MEPLTKADLNNYIVSMRHNVRRARTQTVNKLSKQIKALRAKKGTDEEVNKNASKANRLAMEILTMKKLKDDDVSKFCLQNSKDPTQLLADVNNDIETKAKAKLSMHDSLVGVIVKFHMKYPDWKESVPRVLALKKDFFKKLKESRQEENKAKKKISKEKIKEKVLNTKKIEVNYKGNTFIISSVLPVVETSQYDKKNKGKRKSVNNDVENVEVSRKKKFEQRSKLPTKENHQSVSPKSKSNNLDSENTDDENNYTEEIPDVQFKKVDQSPKKTNETTKLSSKSEVLPEQIGKEVDPFFITRDNKDYLSYGAAKALEDAAKEERNERRGFKSFNKFDNWNKSKGYNQFENKEKGNFSKFKTKGSHLASEKPKNFKKTDGYHGGKPNRNISHELALSPAEDKDKLHPSWEAKKKASSLLAFQGKKITFDND